MNLHEFEFTFRARPRVAGVTRFFEPATRRATIHICCNPNDLVIDILRMAKIKAERENPDLFIGSIARAVDLVTMNSPGVFKI